MAGNESTRARLCVLASGSSGNCSVLEVRRGGERRVALIDLGLSPRRTTRLLEERGVGVAEVSDVLLTHLDSDHCHHGWFGRRDRLGATIRLHRRHVGWARRRDADLWRTEPFAGAFELFAGVRVTPLLTDHDDLGTASFRIDLPGASLGVATDLGSVTGPLIDHLAGVDVLAIESNYCPTLQEASARPAFLKRRIMGGAGHLSNEQCRRAVEMIAPSAHVVFLHLSRECNRPELVDEMHAGAPYRRTISAHDAPTDWIDIRRGEAVAARGAVAPQGAPGACVQGGLFDGLAGGRIGA